MCSAVTVSWVGAGVSTVVGPEEGRGCAERWRGSGEGGGGGRGDKDETRRQEGDAKPAVGSAKGAGGRGVKTARRRTLEIRVRSGGAGGKGRHSLCKSKCSLSPRGGLLEGPEVRSTRGVCVARVQQNEAKRARKKKARGRESEGRNKRVVGEGGTTSASETWGAARRAEGPPWCGRGHCQVGVA